MLQSSSCSVFDQKRLEQPWFHTYVACPVYALSICPRLSMSLVPGILLNQNRALQLLRKPRHSKWQWPSHLLLPRWPWTQRRPTSLMLLTPCCRQLLVCGIKQIPTELLSKGVGGGGWGGDSLAGVGGRREGGRGLVPCFKCFFNISV